MLSSPTLAAAPHLRWSKSPIARPPQPRQRSVLVLHLPQTFPGSDAGIRGWVPVGDRNVAKTSVTPPVWLTTLCTSSGLSKNAEPAGRSEEHTSELQSLTNLVC